MSKFDKTRKYLIDILDWQSAHMNFDSAVADFPQKHYNTKLLKVSYTFWHLIEHIRITQWDILEFCINPNYKEMKWPDDYWPRNNEKADKRKWNNTIKKYKSDLSKLKKLVKNPKTDLFKPIPWGDGQTIFREIVLVADHTAYHVGELGILRQVVGTWPKGRK